jgi:large subunit ribosomal protein L21
MAYAIIETGGKQLRVEPGRFYDVERLAVEAEESLTIDRVLFVENDGEISVGQPLVEGASIEAKVLRHSRGRKVIVYKMQPKKKTRKKRGHRQEITRILINSITLNGTSIGSAPESSAADATVEAETVEA